MKNLLSVITLLLLIFSTSSCKKENTIDANASLNAKLIGIWNEQSPCAAGAGSCFTLQFSSNYLCRLTSPYTDSVSYSIHNGDSIYFSNNQYLKSYKLNIKGDTILTIEKLYGGASVGGPVPYYDVTLFKSH